MLTSRKTRGDTLIEVLFAVSVFSLVVVSGLAVMNQGAAASQRALEITLVRQQIDAQADTLRFLNNSYVAAYNKGSTYDPTTPAGQWALMLDGIKNNGGANSASSFIVTTCPTTYPTGSFIMDPRYAKYVDSIEGVLTPAVTFSQIEYKTVNGQPVFSKSNGLWIEAVQAANSTDTAQANIGYIDFHIRACWDGPGQAVPMTLGTIVRLYEPK